MEQVAAGPGDAGTRGNGGRRGGDGPWLTDRLEACTTIRQHGRRGSSSRAPGGEVIAGVMAR